jgi:magnesium transporter
MIAGLLDVYLSSISNRTNDVMRILTIITTIFMPLTFLAGIYGMNFEYMPELQQPMGYPAVLIICGIIAAGMFVFFRRKGWL